MALPTGNLFVDPNIKLVAPELPVEEMKYVWDTKQKIYDKNLEDVTKIGMLAENTKGAIGDTDLVKNTVSEYGNMIGNISQSGDFENQTLAVNSLAKKYFTDPRIQQFNKNYLLQEAEAAHRNKLIEQGKIPLDFNEKTRNTFQSIGTDENGNQIFQTYTPGVEEKGNWEGQMQQLVAGIAGDTWDIPPSIWRDKDNAATIMAIRQGRGGGVSQQKIEKLVNALLPTYINATAEGRQHLRAYSELESYKNKRQNPVEAIRQEMLSIARKQKSSNVDYTYSNFTQPDSDGDPDSPDGAGKEYLPYTPTKTNEFAKNLKSKLYDIYTEFGQTGQTPGTKPAGLSLEFGALGTDAPQDKRVRKEKDLNISLFLERLTSEEKESAQAFFKTLDPSLNDKAKLAAYDQYLTQISETKGAAAYESILEEKDRKAATDYIRANIGSRRVWSVDDGEFVTLAPGAKDKATLKGQLTPDNPIYDDVKQSIIEEGSGTPDAAKLFSRGYLFTVGDKNYIIGESEASVKSPKSSVHFDSFVSEFTSAKRNARPVRFGKTIVTHIPGTEQYEVTRPTGERFIVDVQNPAQLKAIFNILKRDR
jgi:hypothetical protein